MLSLLYGPALPSVYDYWKNHSLDYMDLCWQIISPLFNMLFSFVIAFLPRSKHLLISWLQSPSSVILEPKKIKSVSVSVVSPFICREVMGLDTIFALWMLNYKPTFHSPLSPHQEILQFFFAFCHKGGVICISEVSDISPSNPDSSLSFI